MEVRLLDADRIGAIAVLCDAMSIESVPSQETQAHSENARRINRLIEYLRGNLDRQVKLEELAKIACTLRGLRSRWQSDRALGAIQGVNGNPWFVKPRMT
jgi:transcriptional regulator GlxA family with amidase domain